MSILTRLSQELALAVKECFTSSSGEYDPARAIGYLIVVIGAFTFIGLSVYDTVKNAKFDYVGYATGLGGIAIAITGAAAGVWLKKGAESLPKNGTEGEVK